MRSTFFLFSILLLIFGQGNATAQNIYENTETRVVTKMLGNDSIHSNLSLKENLSKINAFSRQVQVFDLVNFDELIARQQMVTVFVVKNTAFDFMDKKELEEFLTSTNAKNLSQMQSSYIIPGRVDAHAINKAVSDGGGAASFRTIDNKSIRFLSEGDAVYIITENGSKSKLLETNFYHNKGFFHITEKLPIRK